MNLSDNVRWVLSIGAVAAIALLVGFIIFSMDRRQVMEEAKIISAQAYASNDIFYYSAGMRGVKRIRTIPPNHGDNILVIDYEDGRSRYIYNMPFDVLFEADVPDGFRTTVKEEE